MAMVEIGEIKVLKDDNNYIYCQVKADGKTYKIGPYESDIHFKAFGLDIQVLIRDEDANRK